MNEQMKDELSKFGLNATEQEVLLFLLRFGARSAGVIAQKLSTKRPTVYSALENLIKYNVVKKDSANGKYNFRAVPAIDIPDILLRNAESRLEKLKFSAELLKKPLEALNHFSKTNIGSFEFELIDSSSRYAEFMFQNNWSRNYLSIWDPAVSAYSKDTERDIEAVLSKSSKSRNKIREILVKGKMTDWYLSKIKNPNHEYKVIDSSIITKADLTLYEESDTLISLMTPNSETGLLIHNKDLYRFFKQIFDHLWATII